MWKIRCQCYSGLYLGDCKISYCAVSCCKHSDDTDLILLMLLLVFLLLAGTHSGIFTSQEQVSKFGQAHLNTAVSDVLLQQEAHI